MTSVEIHCPSCGHLLRRVKNQSKCPDCGNNQAIFLPYLDIVARHIHQGHMIQANERRSAERILELLLDGLG